MWTQDKILSTGSFLRVFCSTIYFGGVYSSYLLLLIIFKVLLCLGPVFFLEQCTIYRRHKGFRSFISNIWDEQNCIMQF